AGGGRDRDPADHEPDADVRPPAGRRRARRPLPPRPAREAPELGRGQVLELFVVHQERGGPWDWFRDMREQVHVVHQERGGPWDLQRSLAAAIGQGAMPETIVLLEHPPVVTLGRRSEEGELHLPAGAEVEIVETDRGGKSTYHAPGQLVCYPILDLKRHGTDVKKYVRDLEEALIRTLAPLGVEAERLEGLTGVWLQRPPRKIASIGVHISRWVT